jgi:hypothetical protein
MALIAATLGQGHVLWEIGICFSQLAIVTFGGAYAVLAYMAQEAVQGFSWLQAGEMADGLGLDGLTKNFLGVLAANRRLALLPAVIRDFAALNAARKGEVTATVTAAHKLTAAQQKALGAKLKAGIGRDVALTVNVDPSILGGLMVRVGSRLIDSSLKTRLDMLGQALKA